MQIFGVIPFIKLASLPDVVQKYCYKNYIVL